MRKRVALKILKNKDRLRYKLSQIREAEKIARKYGIELGESAKEGQSETADSSEE